MDTRLEGDIERGAARVLSRGRERDDLGVSLPKPGVKSLANDGAVANDDGADHRVRRRLSPPAPGEVERPTHVRAIRVLVRRGPGAGVVAGGWWLVAGGEPRVASGVWRVASGQRRAARDSARRGLTEPAP